MPSHLIQEPKVDKVAKEQKVNSSSIGKQANKTEEGLTS